MLAALAPLYRLFPSPYTLLLAQAALLALAVVPLARQATRVLGRRAAHVIAFGYGLSWGIASAVGFDFHEVCFAVPLVSYALEALARRSWRRALAWAVPLLLVKEDLGLTLAAIGAYVAWRGPRRLGIAAAVLGLVGSALEFKVLMPFFNPSGTYAHAANLAPAHHSLLTTLALAPLDAVRPEVKATTLVLVFAPAALIAAALAARPDRRAHPRLADAVHQRLPLGDRLPLLGRPDARRVRGPDRRAAPLRRRRRSARPAPRAGLARDGRRP